MLLLLFSHASLAVGLTEGGTAADALSDRLDYVPALSEGGTAADSALGSLSTAVTVSEAGTATDSFSEYATFSVAVAEGGDAADAVSSQASYLLALTEAGTATDAASLPVYHLSIGENVDAIDALQEQLSYRGSLNESAAAIDSLGPQRLPSLDIRKQSYPVLSLNVPKDGSGLQQWLRNAAQHINAIRGGAHNTTTSLTLNTNSSSTTLTDARISAQSYVHLSPLTQSAAQEQWWIASQGQGSVVVGHSNSADPTRTYRVNIVA